MYSNKVLNNQTSKPTKIKSLEELQSDAKKRNDAEAERICNNIKLCCGWSLVLGLFCYLIVLIISISLNDYDKNNSVLIVEKENINSGSN